MSDAFTRAVEGLKRNVPELQYAPDRVRQDIVRAVLEAVREPDDEVTQRDQSSQDEFCRTVVKQVRTAMIDAIIIQDPNIPVVGKLVMDKDTTTGEAPE